MQGIIANILTKITDVFTTSHKISDDITAFFGGAIGVLTLKYNTLNFIKIFQTDEFLDFSIRAFFGGLVALSFKLIGEVIIKLINNKKPKL